MTAAQPRPTQEATKGATKNRPSGPEPLDLDNLPRFEVPLEDRLEHEAAVAPPLPLPEKPRPKRKEVLVDAETQRVMKRPPRRPNDSDAARVMRDVSAGAAGGIALGVVVYLVGLLLVP
jgi:hypothetical protein